MVRWGVLGCGRIAAKFAEAVLKAVDGSSLQAAAARDKNRAGKFSKNYGIENFYGSYQELVEDKDVDAIYIATPHSHHEEHALLCLEHGKAVLCEKPFAINSEQSKVMIKRAQEKNLFLMEALWMRFLPVMTYVKELLAEGTLGEVKSVTADFSFKGSNDETGRLLNPDLAGGALLDVGIYPLNLALLAFSGKPIEVKGSAEIGRTGVDQCNSFTLNFEGGGIAQCTSAVDRSGDRLGRIECENGVIEIPMFSKGENLILTRNGAQSEEMDFSFDCNGFEYEVRHTADCINKGMTESDVMSFDETLIAMEIMDGLRRDWNFVYPMERI